MNDKFSSLRQKAENIINKSDLNVDETTITEFKQVIHELKVYQIELEIQNEDLRNTQKQLENSRNQYALLYNQAPVGYVTLEHSSVISQSNQTFVELLGLSQESIIGKSFSEFIHEEDKGIFLGRYNAFFKSPESKNIQVRIINSRKEIIYVSLKASLKTLNNDNTLENSQESKLFLIISDITDRIVAEDELNLNRKRLDDAMEFGKLAWWEMNCQTGEVSFNERKVTMLGYNPKDFNQFRDFTDKVHPDDFEPVMNNMMDLINKKIPLYLIDYRMKNIENEYIWFSDVGGITNYDKFGNPLIVTGIVVNINDRKIAENKILKLVGDLQDSQKRIQEHSFEIMQLNDELIKSEEVLKEINRKKDKFFSIIAHDLRAPISGFIGLSEILTKDPESLSIKELKEISIAINQSANNIYDLLNELLQWSRSQSGALSFKLEKVNLFELIYNIVFLLKSSSDSKNINVINKCQTDLYVNCDRNMLMTVVRNFLSNSIKFTNNNGLIVLSSEIRSGYIEISITDNGIGMTETLLSSLFKYDSINSNLGTNNEKGTGLGLVLCKEFIEKHQGKIWVNSEIGKGSTFYFTIPDIDFMNIE